MSEGLETVEELKHEIERLNRELAQTSHDKIQSAQYGLVLLDEKETLQQKYEEVELQYESTKNELELLREVIISFYYLICMLWFVNRDKLRNLNSVDYPNNIK